MVWQRIKRLFGGAEPAAPVDPPGAAEMGWIEATDSPWGARVLDVRPWTLTMLSATQNPDCAKNLVSLGQEDGAAFVGTEPQSERVVGAALRYRVEGPLPDGVLFAPQEMEHKWGLYVSGGRIVVVRSWTRAVHVIAELTQGDGFVEVPVLRGAIAGEDEDPAWTVRAFDALMRTHALDTVYPVPLPTTPQGPEAIRGAAVWCMSMFGNLAHYGATEALPTEPPKQPLRVDSLLHIAVARGDVTAVNRLLDAGMPCDARARGGLTPLHWSVQVEGREAFDVLVRRGARLDVRSDSGTTPLMEAVQRRSKVHVARLLGAGADVDLGDERGFTALHRAAEMGQADLVDLLLARGAAPDPYAEGHSPRTLAASRNERTIVARLDRAIGGRR